MDSRPPVRVTHVVFDLDGGGLETLVGEMARCTAGSPVVTSIITLSGRVGRVGAAAREQVDQFHVVRPVPLASMALPLGLARAIRRTRADVVHLHSGAWYKPVRAARLARVKRVVFTEHGREHFDPPLLKWLDRRAARRTDAVVAVSDRLARYLREDVGIAPELVRTIPNGIDIDRFAPGPAPDALRARLALPRTADVVGSVGRLEPVKAYDRLLDAYAALRCRRDGAAPVYLVLCGDGSQRGALERRATELGIADGVRFTGWTDRALDFYRLFDVFALTSRSEGVSVSLIEAMACTAAPVVTDVGANAEVVGPELADQVVPGWDARAFADALDRALRGQGQERSLGGRARLRVAGRHSLSGMLAAYEQLYRGAF